jgi:CoA:oxalate CoA-transferase
MVLGDLGAEIVKIERPGVGDAARGNGPFINGESSYFMSINRGKESLTLDLSSPKGRDIFLRLVCEADVVVENMRPGSMKGLGLDYDVLKEYNPELIYAAISGFGQTGPYSLRPALDVIVQGMGGIMSITGETGGPPVRPGASYGDIVAGLFTVIGILAAIQDRARSGKGQMLDMSMLDCQVAVLENAFTRYFVTGEAPQPIGTRHPVFTPFQAFQTQDGWLVVAVMGGANDKWPLFCVAIDRIDLIDDERFLDGWGRTRHYEVLEPILSSVMLQKTTQQWIELFLEQGIACGPVNSIPQVVEDPHVNFRGMFSEIEYPNVGKVKTVGSPIRLSGSEPEELRPAPGLGEHSENVLKRILELQAEEITQLRQEGII